jgi:hypothetical protein
MNESPHWRRLGGAGLAARNSWSEQWRQQYGKNKGRAKTKHAIRIIGRIEWALQ